MVMRKTKIVCTIGPSADTADRLAALMEAGMNVARLNLSHGRREDHLRRLELIREVSRDLKLIVAILIDTRGPEIRTGELAEDKVLLEDGQDFILTAATVRGNREMVGVTYPELPRNMVPGKVILIDDGLIKMKVKEISGDDICCEIIDGGELRSYKGLNIPGTYIPLPPLGDKDREDLQFFLELGVNFIATSFTRNRDDVLEVLRLLEMKRSETKIISKIESMDGVDNFQEILQVTDGIMVARGDLGVELPAEEVPLLQKRFIEACNRLGKPVITATQMLDSMICNPRPTRAEASDVANAILDGTDAVMLSGETAIGRFPVEAVKTMSRIAERTEEALQHQNMMDRYAPATKKSVTDAISYATCHIAQNLGASAVITATQSGHTARMVSKYRPEAPIFAVTPCHLVAHSLQLTWGVYPVLCLPTETTDEMFAAAIRASLREGLIQNGEMVVITAGVPVGVSGTTNLLRVETVGEILLQGTGVGKISASGTAFVVKDSNKTEDILEGQILVAKGTDRHYLAAIEKAAAVVAEEGGLTSHTAIVALKLGKPVIVGAENAIDLIKNGDEITVDAARGLIYRGKATVL